MSKQQQAVKKVTEVGPSELQDLWHYALAMRGDDRSAFPHTTLWSRLQAADNVDRKLTALRTVEAVEYYEAYAIGAQSFERESQLTDEGESLMRAVQAQANLYGVDPFTGEKPDESWKNATHNPMSGARYIKPLNN